MYISWSVGFHHSSLHQATCARVELIAEERGQEKKSATSNDTATRSLWTIDRYLQECLRTQQHASPCMFTHSTRHMVHSTLRFIIEYRSSKEYTIHSRYSKHTVLARWARCRYPSFHMPPSLASYKLPDGPRWSLDKVVSTV